MGLSVDRIQGLSGGLALKAPCRTATTANLPVRAELLEVGGVVLAAGDRVLVKDQTDSTENGVFVADEGNWKRALDFNGPNDILSGTWVTVSSGTYKDYIFGVRFAGDFDPGVTELTITGELVIGFVALVEAAAATSAANAATTTADRNAAAASAFTADADATAAAASAAAASDSEIAAVAAADIVVGWEWKGEWLTATSYAVNNVVRHGSSAYIAVAAHTSGVFNTDLAVPRWALLAFGASGAGTGDMLGANNLSDVVSAATSRTNLGLGNVNNTSDANKPVSTATQTALDLKQATLVSATNIKTVNSTSLLGAGDIAISGGGSYDVSAFISNGTYELPQDKVSHIIAIGGGGAGGAESSGDRATGGNGGGVCIKTVTPVAPLTLTFSMSSGPAGRTPTGHGTTAADTVVTGTGISMTAPGGAGGRASGGNISSLEPVAPTGGDTNYTGGRAGTANGGASCTGGGSLFGYGSGGTSTNSRITAGGSLGGTSATDSTASLPNLPNNVPAIFMSAITLAGFARTQADGLGQAGAGNSAGRLASTYGLSVDGGLGCGGGGCTVSGPTSGAGGGGAVIILTEV